MVLSLLLSLSLYLPLSLCRKHSEESPPYYSTPPYYTMCSDGVRDALCSAFSGYSLLTTVVVGLTSILLVSCYCADWLTVLREMAIFHKALIISPVTFVVMYLVWYNNSACEVSWAKKAFLNGYKGEIASPKCLINRSEVIQTVVHSFPLYGLYHVLEGPHGCGKTTAVQYALNTIGFGAVYISVELDQFDESLASAFNLGYICKPQFLQYLGNHFGVGNACPKTALDRVTNILSIKQGCRKNWVFTYNNPIMEPLLQSSMLYIIFGREISPSGTPHLQGYVQFEKQLRFAKAKSYLPEGCHLEAAKGSYDSNKDYCSKDGDFKVQGVPSLTANEIRKRSRDENCTEIVALHKKKVKISSITESFPSLWKDVQGLINMRHTSRTSTPKVLYIYGKSGVGKSYNTEEAIKDLGLSYYFKPSGSRWWPEYDQEDVVILEEFTSCFTCSQFLQLCDKAPYQVEYKGGFTHFNSGHIIILSNMGHGEQYSNVRQDKLPQWEAYMRRVQNYLDVSAFTHEEIMCAVNSFLS